MVLTRQIETDDKIDEPPTHILQQVISNNHQQSPVSESSSKEEIKDPLEIRTLKLTAEEKRKKEARREKAREQSKHPKVATQRVVSTWWIISGFPKFVWISSMFSQRRY